LQAICVENASEKCPPIQTLYTYQFTGTVHLITLYDISHPRKLQANSAEIMTSFVLVGHSLKHAEGDTECPMCSEMEHPHQIQHFSGETKT
jgi:hypothetical protein